MASKLEITDYYELVALHRALHVARFARDPLVPEIPGSPFLANISRRVVETLAQMEIERGKPERASDWQMKIDETGEVWQIAASNGARNPNVWNKWTHQQQADYARILLSPFTFTDEMLEHFVQQVNALKEKQNKTPE